MFKYQQFILTINLVIKLVEVGNRMAMLRHDNDLKQKDVAKILNVKENTYSKWEKCSNRLLAKLSI